MHDVVTATPSVTDYASEATRLPVPLIGFGTSVFVMLT
jgi:hypothetical protein